MFERKKKKPSIHLCCERQRPKYWKKNMKTTMGNTETNISTPTAVSSCLAWDGIPCLAAISDIKVECCCWACATSFVTLLPPLLNVFENKLRKKQDRSRCIYFYLFFSRGTKEVGGKVTIPKSSDDVCFNEDERRQQKWGES